MSQEQLDQAVSIIRQRVDASGVSEAEINTQGGQNVVVAIPGELDEQTRDRIESSAKLELRPVLLAERRDQPVDRPERRAPSRRRRRPALESTPTLEPTERERPELGHAGAAGPVRHLRLRDLDEGDANVAPPTSRSSRATLDGTVKYLLGPVEVDGEDIVDATNGMVQTQTGATTGQWAVNIVFNERGTEEFAEVSQRLFALNGQTPRDQFAFVLDGAVSVGAADERRHHRRPSAGHRQLHAGVLEGARRPAEVRRAADQLRGAVLRHHLGDARNLAAADGLIAGIIGLILVAIYTLFQYRALGSVTIASLVIVGVLTYLTITILSWRGGYRLSLAGRRPDRRDRLHGRLVHRVLRARPRRAARRPAARRCRRGRLEARAAHDLLLEGR